MATPYLGMTGLKIARRITPVAKPRSVVPINPMIPKPMATRPKVAAGPSAHDAHIAHVAHLAQAKKAAAAKTSTKGAGAASKSKTSSTTLDAHQLHVLHLAHLGSISGGASTSSPITPTSPGGVVGPISSTTDTGSTGTSVTSSLFRIVEYAAIILFLIWAWRKGYIQAALKRVGKLGQNSGDKIAKLGKGK